MPLTLVKRCEAGEQEVLRGLELVSGDPENREDERLDLVRASWVERDLGFDVSAILGGRESASEEFFHGPHRSEVVHVEIEAGR